MPIAVVKTKFTVSFIILFSAHFRFVCLRAPALDHCSLSHRSSSSVYSTILSRGSISDSCYLYLKLQSRRMPSFCACSMATLIAPPLSSYCLRQPTRMVLLAGDEAAWLMKRRISPSTSTGIRRVHRLPLIFFNWPRDTIRYDTIPLRYVTIRDAILTCDRKPT